MRQTQVSAARPTRGSAMVVIPDGGELTDAAVVALIEAYLATAAGGLGIGHQGLGGQGQPGPPWFIGNQ
jgi:hypothetical protein